MSSIYDGHVVAALHKGAPIKSVWEGAILTYDYAAVLKDGPNTTNAQRLIAFLNRAQIAAAWTQGTGFPNTNQLKYLPAGLTSQVSVNPQDASKCILEDSAWLVAKRSDGNTNADHIQERWFAWRAGWLRSARRVTASCRAGLPAVVRTRATISSRRSLRFRGLQHVERVGMKTRIVQRHRRAG